MMIGSIEGSPPSRWFSSVCVCFLIVVGVAYGVLATSGIDPNGVGQTSANIGNSPNENYMKNEDKVEGNHQNSGNPQYQPVDSGYLNHNQQPYYGPAQPPYQNAPPSGQGNQGPYYHGPPPPQYQNSPISGSGNQEPYYQVPPLPQHQSPSHFSEGNQGLYYHGPPPPQYQNIPHSGRPNQVPFHQGLPPPPPPPPPPPQYQNLPYPDQGNQEPCYHKPPPPPSPPPLPPPPPPPPPPSQLSNNPSLHGGYFSLLPPNYLQLYNTIPSDEETLKKELKYSREVLKILHTFLGAQKKIEWMEKSYSDLTRCPEEKWNHLPRIQKWDMLFTSFNKFGRNKEEIYKGIPLLQGYFRTLNLQNPIQMAHAMNTVYDDASEAIHKFLWHEPVNFDFLTSTAPIAQLLSGI